MTSGRVCKGVIDGPGRNGWRAMIGWDEQRKRAAGACGRIEAGREREARKPVAVRSTLLAGSFLPTPSSPTPASACSPSFVTLPSCPASPPSAPPPPSAPGQRASPDIICPPRHPSRVLLPSACRPHPRQTFTTGRTRPSAQAQLPPRSRSTTITQSRALRRHVPVLGLHLSSRPEYQSHPSAPPPARRRYWRPPRSPRFAACR